MRTMPQSVYRYIFDHSRWAQVVVIILTLGLLPLAPIPLELQRRLLDDAVADFGVLFASMSHTLEGRSVLEEAWEYGTGHDHTLEMSLAFLAGDWNTEFLMRVADDVFSDNDSLAEVWARYSRPDISSFNGPLR